MGKADVLIRIGTVNKVFMGMIKNVSERTNWTKARFFLALGYPKAYKGTSSGEVCSELSGIKSQRKLWIFRSFLHFSMFFIIFILILLYCCHLTVWTFFTFPFLYCAYFVFLKTAVWEREYTILSTIIQQKDAKKCTSDCPQRLLIVWCPHLSPICHVHVTLPYQYINPRKHCQVRQYSLWG